MVAVEGDRIANRFAKRNARSNGIKNLTVERQSVESWIRYLPPGRDLVVVDPPRFGLIHEVRRALIEQRPKRLTYVSCHAATLARDLKQLARGFRIESLTLLDMFPQTGHMEDGRPAGRPRPVMSEIRFQEIEHKFVVGEDFDLEVFRDRMVSSETGRDDRTARARRLLSERAPSTVRLPASIRP